MSGGALTYAEQAVADTSGSASVRIQNPTAPPLAWCKVNVIMDVAGSASCALMVDGVVVDQAGGPQPQLGPAVFTGSQNVNVLVTGAQPSSQIVAHVSGAWDDSLSNLDGISTLSGGTISAAQLVGTPFLESAAVSIVGAGTYTSPTYPMLGYAGVLAQIITTVGSLTAMPVATLQWLDSSGNVIYQSNWQSQKVIDTVSAWGQNVRLVIANQDATHPAAVSVTLVPVAQLPPQKGAALTYKQTTLNELVGLHNTACTSGSTITATTPAGLGYAGPATLYCNPDPGGVLAAAGVVPQQTFAITYGPTGTGKSLATWVLCPVLYEQIDLPAQPLTISLTNNNSQTVTPDISIVAGYR